MANVEVVTLSGADDPLDGPTAANLAALQAWFLAHGGMLHSSVTFAAPSPNSYGAHIALAVDAGPIRPMTDLLHVPYKTSLSVLSIPHIAPFWPPTFFDTFSDAPQVLARFAIVEAWLQREHGFWWPFLRTVPQPKQDGGHDPFDTPLYWTKEDREWLKGSRLDAATTEREERWLSEFELGIQTLKNSEVQKQDREHWKAVQPAMWEAYTWSLYLWATTLLTSRSFPSGLLIFYTPEWEEDSNWGRSAIARSLRNQQAAQSLQKFPVLFPGFDLTNHNPRARVRWEVGNDDVQLITHDKLEGCPELFNNYGPKSNDELLMGYGFVLEDNEDDTVSFSANTHTSTSRLADELALGMKKGNPVVALDTNANLAEPSTSTGQQTSARRDSPSYAIPIEKLPIFSETRALRVIVPGERKTQFNDVLRGALSLTQAHDLAVQFANKRELKALRESNIMTDFLPLTPTRNVCLIADRTILALRNYRGRLQRDMPKENPTNHRQWMAATFWQGQAKIVGGNIELLEKFLLGLQKDGYIITLQQILTNVNVSPDAIRLPLRAILEGGCQIKLKARHVMENSLLEFAFVVWFGLLWFHQGVSGPGQSSSGAIALTEVLKDWVEFVKKQYGEELGYDVAGDLNPPSPETLQQASNSGRTQRYLEIIQRFAADETQALAPVFQNSFWNRGILTAAIDVFCEESVAFESMDRLIFNGAEEVDEPFLFLERCD